MSRAEIFRNSWAKKQGFESWGDLQYSAGSDGYIDEMMEDFVDYSYYARKEFDVTKYDKNEKRLNG